MIKNPPMFILGLVVIAWCVYVLYRYARARDSVVIISKTKAMSMVFISGFAICWMLVRFALEVIKR